MPEATDRYTATRLSAELGLDNRKMRDILTRVNPVQVKGRSKLYLLRDVIPHAAKYLGAPDVIDLNAERARKVKAEAELAEIVTFSGHKINSPVLHTYVKPGREAAIRALNKLETNGE